MSRALRSALVAVVLVVIPAASAAAAQPPAAGAPGAAPNWTPADKHGFGTAHDPRSKVWFTLRAHSLSEVYYPDLGTPAVRDLKFVVTDGKRFVGHEGPGGEVQSLGNLGYRQVTGTSRWRITKTVITDPRRDTVLLDVRLESLTGRPYRLYAVLDPALSNDGSDDRGRSSGPRLLAWDSKAALALAATPAFGKSSSGYRGTSSDPARDLRDADLDRRTDATRAGNVVQVARTALDGITRKQMTLALGFGRTPNRAIAAARGSLGRGFAPAAAEYAAGWQGYLASLKAPPAAVAPYRALYDQSLLVLAASEDKTHLGAGVASPTMPWLWGDGKFEKPSGPYHLVWGRDLYQVATAQIAAGDRAAAQRALDYLLFTQQKKDGSFPQNSELDGSPHWTSLQLDEVAFPLVIAWQLGLDDAKRWAHLKRAADFVVRTGPRSKQERWENQTGWSPATIAAQIAGLVCAAELARRNGDAASAARYDRVADSWAASVQAWTATDNGPLGPRPYYLRVTKKRDPNQATRYSIGDGGPGKADQRVVVDPSFLELVRLGVKRHDDPAVLNTLQIVDRTLRADTPNGTFWHRFTYDGYGEHRDGSPWVLGKPGTFKTLGRAWPIFAGERGEYELMAGRSADAQLRTMALSSNDGGMMPEQVWDGRPPTGRPRMKAGEGTFSATPLAWTHAQFLRLAWSIDAGAPVETPAIVACRYTGRRC